MPDPLVPPADAGVALEERAAAARAELVAGLEAAGHLHAGPVRGAFLAVRREVLMPQAYARRGRSDETPPRWDLLDWAVPADRDELLGLLYGGESVPVQHDGEPVLGRAPAPRSGGSMTAMSSTAGMTVALLQRLGLRPGQRVLDVGTGAGVTAAVACRIAGDAGVVTVDRDEHVTAAARERLALLGHRPTVVTGDGQHGWPASADYDRIFVSYAVTRVPDAWSQQLAVGGMALATLSTSSPSWPGLAVLTRTGSGRVTARLEAVRLGHRAGNGWSQLYLKPGLRGRIEAADGGSTRTTHTGPPPDDARGLWLALDHLHPGLVRNWAADHLVIGAPDCGSWVTARLGGSGSWTVMVCGPRDIWAEIQDTATRWQAAGSPSSYRLHLEPDGTQWVSAGSGPPELSWPLPTALQQATTVPSPSPEPTLTQKESHPVASSTPASTTARSGGCLCGKVQFTVTGEPDYPHTCSCRDCQGLSGAPMMSWVSFPLDGLAWSGAEPSWHYTWPDSKRGFCPSCGSQICALDDGATSIAVTLSALGNPPDLVPVNQSFRETAVPWLPQVPDTSS